MHGMRPDVDDFAGCGGRFLAREDVDGHRDRDENGGDHRGEDDVAGAFGVGLAGCDVCGFLLEKTHNDLILCPYCSKTI